MAERWRVYVTKRSGLPVRWRTREAGENLAVECVWDRRAAVSQEDLDEVSEYLLRTLEDRGWREGRVTRAAQVTTKAESDAAIRRFLETGDSGVEQRLVRGEPPETVQ